MDVKTGDKDNLRSNVLLVAYLAGCAVREEVPDPARLEGADLDALLDLAAKHMLTAVVATALESAGLGNDRTREGIARAAWRAAQFEAEWEPIRAELEAAGIWYCPLKGMVIKDLYPTYGMREMGDYDILFDPERAEDVRDIMERHGFSVAHYGTGYHDAYHKRPMCNFEMHRALISTKHDPHLVEFFANIKDKLVKDNDSDFGYHMSPSECYLYLVTHEFNHYILGGTGLRSLLDTHVYLREYGKTLDWDSITTDAYVIGITEFELQNRGLARRMFETTCNVISEDEWRMLDYVSKSGTYGTTKQKIENGVTGKGGGTRGKLRYLRSRIFPPMAVLESYYPDFMRSRALLPVLIVYRLGRAVTVRRKSVLAELDILRDIGKR